MYRSSARLLVPALLVAVTVACGGDGGGDRDDGASVARGEELFRANCAACHGEGGTGTVSGPPLVHETYEPSHHGDESFHRAVQEGVQPHHWDFGPMPPLPGLDREEVADIVAYVRQQQRDAGIE